MEGVYLIIIIGISVVSFLFFIFFYFFIKKPQNGGLQKWKPQESIPRGHTDVRIFI